MEELQFSIINLSDSDCYSLINEGVFDSLLHDDNTTEDIVDELTRLFTVSITIKGNFIGLFTLEDKGLFNGQPAIEAHAYILPSYRRYSMKALRKIRDWSLDTAQHKVLLTLVPDYCEPYRAVIERIGFKEFIHESNLVKKDGIDYGATYYYYINK